MLDNRIKKFASFLRIAIGQQLHRTFHVCEKHRDLLALAFERAFSCENLLGEMLGGIGLRRSESGLYDGLGAKWLATLETELRAGGKLGAAFATC
jgi:hypothetical protein